jgi:hypothetical protein
MLSTLLAQKPLGGVFEGLGRFQPTADAPAQQINNIFTMIFGFLTIVGGLAFLIYFAIGGISWITAGGDQQKVDAAKSYMTNGAVGMIVIAAAYAIVSVVGDVLGFPILDPAAMINQIVN